MDGTLDAAFFTGLEALAFSAALEAVGYEVVSTEYRLVVPTMLNGFPDRVKNLYQKFDRPVWLANALLERTWPFNRVASNLMLAARKPE